MGLTWTALNDGDDYKDPYVVRLDEDCSIGRRGGTSINSFQQQHQQQYQNEINAFSRAKIRMAHRSIHILSSKDGDGKP